MADVYLDNNATTRVDEEVVQAMLPFFTEQFGNPSSLHSFGNQV
ncbi:aminotransferase class V-fold PLP-dependent enzyme, partial [Azotobacter chroococcum]|nr:aminotransferase class V-fold PLP-dependent enzyme [Azotobacter chroococcum]